MSRDKPAESGPSEQLPPSLKCSICGTQFEAEDRFFGCHPCTRGEFAVCQTCALSDSLDVDGHDPRPCFFDSRDHRATFLPAPSISEFGPLILAAREDSSFKFPWRTRKFLHRTVLDGINTERLKSLDSYCRENHGTDVQGLQHTMPNNYSLFRELNSQSKEIRVAALSAGRPEDPVIVSLLIFAFPWKEDVKYMAISYRWGELDETRSVAVYHFGRRPRDGEEPEAVGKFLAITANLEIILRNLRNPERYVYLWIDAICINQSNPQERAEQVNMMSEIYAGSSVTIVSLRLNPEELRAFQLVHVILGFLKARKDECADPDRFDYVQGFVVTSRIAVNGKELRQIDLARESSILFKNEWFSRVWVLQEVLCTTSTVYVHADAPVPSILWNDLVMVQDYLVSANRFLKAAVNALHPPWLEFEWRQSDAPEKPSKFLSIKDLLAHIGCNFSATDPRDKLFALLSIAEETHDSSNLSPLIKPDYTKSVAQVYMDFTKWCVHQDRTLNVLGYVTYSDRTSISVDEKHQLPTWTFSPQQRFRRHEDVLCNTGGYRTAAETEVDFTLLNNTSNCNSLQLRGYRLSNITLASRHYFISRPMSKTPVCLQADDQDMFFYAGVHFLWRSVFGQTREHTRFCKPVPGSDRCSGKQEFHHFLSMACCKGLPRRGSKELYPTRLLNFEGVYETFASYWMEFGYNFADPEMESFCPHVRDLIMPLVGRASPIRFEAILFGSLTRRATIATDDRIGLGPPVTRTGDIVVALFGGKTPYVIRPRQKSDEKEQEWEFIGECFFYDFMDGQYVQDKIDRHEPSEIFTFR